MSHYSKFSTEEDKIIVEYVSKYMYNITKGLEEANKLMPDRDFYTIRTRWYRYLKHNAKSFELKNNSESLVNTKVKRDIIQDINQDITPEELIFLKFIRVNKINLSKLKEEIIDKKVKEYREQLEA